MVGFRSSFFAKIGSTSLIFSRAKTFSRENPQSQVFAQAIHP